MPTKGTRSRQRTSVRQTKTVQPSHQQQDRFLYVLLIILALCLLGWIISRIPIQVWNFLLLFVVLLVLLMAVGGVLFLVYRARLRPQGEDIVKIRQPERRQRVQSSRAYQRGYQEVQSYQRFWGDIRNVKTRNDLQGFSATGFEEICGDLLHLLGYTNIEHVGGRGDQGVDLRAIDPQGRNTIVQCKRYGVGNFVTPSKYRELLGAMKQHNAEKGIFFTTSDFTADVVKAHKERTTDDVMLVDGKKMVQLIHQTTSIWS